MFIPLFSAERGKTLSFHRGDRHHQDDPIRCQPRNRLYGPVVCRRVKDRKPNELFHQARRSSGGTSHSFLLAYPAASCRGCARERIRLRISKTSAFKFNICAISPLNNKIAYTVRNHIICKNVEIVFISWYEPIVINLTEPAYQ